MRMRREACHNGLTRIGQVVREGGHFVAVHPRVDEQHASPAVHDNGVALAEFALWISTPSATCLSTGAGYRAQRPPTAISRTALAPAAAPARRHIPAEDDPSMMTSRYGRTRRPRRVRCSRANWLAARHFAGQPLLWASSPGCWAMRCSAARHGGALPGAGPGCCLSCGPETGSPPRQARGRPPSPRWPGTAGACCGAVSSPAASRCSPRP